MHGYVVDVDARPVDRMKGHLTVNGPGPPVENLLHPLAERFGKNGIQPVVGDRHRIPLIPVAALLLPFGHFAKSPQGRLPIARLARQQPCQGRLGKPPFLRQRRSRCQ